MFWVHPHQGPGLRPGQDTTPGGELRLQLSPYQAEQGVSQEGALQ